MKLWRPSPSPRPWFPAGWCWGFCFFIIGSKSGGYFIARKARYPRFFVQHTARELHHLTKKSDVLRPEAGHLG